MNREFARHVETIGSRALSRCFAPLRAGSSFASRFFLLVQGKVTKRERHLRRLRLSGVLMIYPRPGPTSWPGVQIRCEQCSQSANLHPPLLGHVGAFRRAIPGAAKRFSSCLAPLRAYPPCPAMLGLLKGAERQRLNFNGNGNGMAAAPPRVGLCFCLGF